MTTIIRTAKLDASGRPIYSEWLIRITPGAAEARAEWEALAAEARPYADAVGAAIKAKNALGRVANGVFVPNPGVTTADYEAALANLHEAEQAQKAHGRKMAAARKRYDDLIKYAPADPETRKKAAAEYAVEQHDEVARLWPLLRAALADRDDARDVAGNPGRDWDTSNSLPDGGRVNLVGQVDRILSAAIQGFDVDSLERVAAGEDVASEPALHSMATADTYRAAKEAAERKAAGF
ncbi:hypothetical protein [Arthrobacter sp. NPDC089319]|uniref:hypothetical protein n=1 Tax=Arthrobacter sp. NPDC089319 TaxID=3155915 RepID=UPI003429CACE